MADVVNRATAQHIASVHAPDFDPGAWVIFGKARAAEIPAIRALVAAVPQRHRKVVGDNVVEMDAGEKATVDAALASAAKDVAANELEAADTLMRAFAEVLIDELNANAARVKAILDAVDAATNLTTLKTAVALITDPPTRNLAQLKTALRAKLNGG